MGLRANLLLAVLIPISAHAIKLEDVLRKAAKEQGICEHYLHEGHYQTSTIIHESPVLTLVPQIGSIEQVHPGVVRSLVRIRVRLIDVKKALDADTNSVTPEQITAEVTTELNNLARTSGDARLVSLVETFIAGMNARVAQIAKSGTALPFKLLPMFLNQMNANLWELTIACLFDGKKLYLNQNLSALYPKEFTAYSNSKRVRHNTLDREIDIAIEKHDGNWIWLEVKDWDMKSALDFESQGKLFVQSSGQDEMRKGLGLNVDLVLVLKYGLPTEDFLNYRLASKFDQILFAFPAGMSTPN